MAVITDRRVVVVHYALDFLRFCEEERRDHDEGTEEETGSVREETAEQL